MFVALLWPNLILSDYNSLTSDRLRSRRKTCSTRPRPRHQGAMLHHSSCTQYPSRRRSRCTWSSPEARSYPFVLVSSRCLVFIQERALQVARILEHSTREPIMVVHWYCLYLSFCSLTALCALALPAPYGLTLWKCIL